MSDEPTYTIEIDRDRCMGSGVCEVYAAATFAIGEDMKSSVIDATGDPLDAIRTAADACPTHAITVRVT